MKVKDLVDILYDYNPNAIVRMCKEGRTDDLVNVSFSSSNGSTPMTADVVYLDADEVVAFDNCG